MSAALCCLALASPICPAAAFDKSGVTPNTISLPSGPGSIEGLGESFQPTLNTGTAKYAVGLQPPPGTAGHAPGLGLRYDGGGSNGPLGYGWSLSTRFVQRQTDKGIPRYVDAANAVDDDRDGETDEADELDTFIDDSSEELVPTAGGHYFHENESAFVRYERVGEHWAATLPNGTRLVFGESEEPPAAGFHLVFLRNNLLTYYEKRLQVPAFHRIVSALGPGGILVIGKKERLPGECGSLVPLTTCPFAFEKAKIVNSEPEPIRGQGSGIRCQAPRDHPAKE